MSAPAWDDDDYITECLKRGEAKAPLLLHHDLLRYCRWCTHTQHGLPCTCGCESAYTSRDDSWRPRDFTSTSYDVQRSRLMDETGVDGWVAFRLIGMPVGGLAAVRQQRIKKALLDPHPREGADE